MKVYELICRLRELPPDFEVRTASGVVVAIAPDDGRRTLEILDFPLKPAPRKNGRPREAGR